jgi:hypothetical protein
MKRTKTYRNLYTEAQYHGFNPDGSLRTFAQWRAFQDSQKSEAQKLAETEQIQADLEYLARMMKGMKVFNQ